MTAARTSRIRWLAAAATAAIAVALVVWLVLARRNHPDARAAGTAQNAPSTTGMTGMEGMAMESEGTARLTADQIRQFGITFGAVERRTLTDAVRTVGAVAVDETGLQQVAPRFGGYVERLCVEATGQRVRRGQPLMTVYSPELLAAQQELLAARALDGAAGGAPIPGVPEHASDLAASARRRLALAGMPEGEIERVLRTGEPLRAVTIAAPASGVVLAKSVVQGQAIQPGQALYTLADLSRVWVDAELRGADAGGVRVGSSADVEVQGLAGRVAGRVAFIYPTLDSASRTVRARIVVDNAAGHLKPGMYATVRLETPARTALTVPSSAVVRTGERDIVFVDMGRGELMTHEVELGRTAGDYTEVLSGVDPGQRVVTSAQFLIDAESNLGDVMRSMMGQTGSADMGDMPGMEMPGMTMPTDKGANVKDAMKGMEGMPTPTPAAPPRKAPR
jgi:membrane fusion protein, copper/silver efflux system